MHLPAILPLFCLYYLVLAVPVAAGSSEFMGRVISVADGDTITVLGDGKRQVRIRLYGIDCPETKQAFGTRARQATSEAVFGEDVTVQIIDTDRYGRAVGIVSTPSGESLNTMLVREGMAWVYTRYCSLEELCGKLRELEKIARHEKRGLWADKKPIPPWEWRKR